MTININPNRINVATGGAGKASDRRRQQHEGDTDVVAPARAHVNIIPEPESLSTLIRSAVAALRKGVYWDRGTILNIVV
jgi:hypothetical protein